MSFGDDSHSALALPSSFREDAYEPSKVSELPSDVNGVIAGHFHSLAVTSGGQVWAWGRYEEAQLGRGGSFPPVIVYLEGINSSFADNRRVRVRIWESWNEPTRVRGLDHVKAGDASASGVVSAAIGEDGSLWVWGKSKRGQLGLGKGATETLLPSRVEDQKIIQVGGLSIPEVSFVWRHSLARKEDRKLIGWGYFTDGRMGTMDGKAECSPLDKSEKVSHHGLPTEVADKSVGEAMEKEKDTPIIWEPRQLEELSDIKVRNVACGF